MNESQCLAGTCKAFRIDGFFDDLSINHEGDALPAFVSTDLDVCLIFLAEQGIGHLPEIIDGRAFLYHEKTCGMAAKLQAVKAAEVRLNVLVGKIDRLQSIAVKCHRHLQRSFPRDVELDAGDVR